MQAESDSRLEALGQQERRQQAGATLDGNLLLRLLTCVLLVMVLGFWLGDALEERLGLVLPSYVGAMFIAIVLRNLDDRLGWLRIPDHAVGTLGDVCLGIFLTMAMMSLKFWELENLGLPLLGVLLIQVAVLLLLTIFVLFRLLGRNYDAAVLCAGFLGHAQRGGQHGRGLRALSGVLAQGLHHRAPVRRGTDRSRRHPGDHLVHQRLQLNHGGAPPAERQLSDEHCGSLQSKRHYSVEISSKFLQSVETIPRKTCLCL